MEQEVLKPIRCLQLRIPGQSGTKEEHQAAYLVELELKKERTRSGSFWHKHSLPMICIFRLRSSVASGRCLSVLLSERLESFVGIRFGTVAGQIMHGDGILMFLQPSFCTRRLRGSRIHFATFSSSAPAALQTG